MKLTSLTLLLAAAACGLAGAQATTTAYTNPVGYTTQTLNANSFNLVGFNVLTPAIASGVLTGVSGATVTDTNVNFTTVLPVGKTCVLEITSGTLLAPGTVQEFVTWSGSTSLFQLLSLTLLLGISIVCESQRLFKRFSLSVFLQVHPLRPLLTKYGFQTEPAVTQNTGIKLTHLLAGTQPQVAPTIRD